MFAGLRIAGAVLFQHSEFCKFKQKLLLPHSLKKNCCFFIGTGAFHGNYLPCSKALMRYFHAGLQPADQLFGSGIVHNGSGCINLFQVRFLGDCRFLKSGFDLWQGR